MREKARLASPAEKTVAGYGAYFLWMLIAPQKFGFAKISAEKMLKCHIAAQRQLRKMFHDAPMSYAAAKRNKRQCGTIFKFAPKRKSSWEISE